MGERVESARGSQPRTATRHRRGMFRTRSLPDLEAFRNSELVDVVDQLGRPLATANLGLGRVIAFWKIGRSRIEIIFDEHHRAERISLS